MIYDCRQKSIDIKYFNKIQMFGNKGIQVNSLKSIYIFNSLKIFWRVVMWKRKMIYFVYLQRVQEGLMGESFLEIYFNFSIIGWFKN